MQVKEALETRRSIRAFLDKPIPQKDLEYVLNAGRLAPSASNEQKWHFIVVNDKELAPKMVECCRGQQFVAQAPVQLAICTYGQREMSCKMPARTVDGSIALTMMMLAAHDVGLGTCWLGHFDQEKVKEVLQIPTEYEVVAVTPLGYPAQEPQARPRKNLEEIISYNKF